jgi:hypothetical protein
MRFILSLNFIKIGWHVLLDCISNLKEYCPKLVWGCPGKITGKKFHVYIHSTEKKLIYYSLGII